MLIFFFISYGKNNFVEELKILLDIDLKNNFIGP